MELIISVSDIKLALTFLAVISGVLVITTRNAVISVFNLIVLYILVAFYLIFIGITYLGISYIVIYIGAIAILFLFVIMMIDIEVLEIKSNNYIPLLLMLYLSFVVSFKNILYNLGYVKTKNFQNSLLINDENMELFNLRNINSIVINNYKFKENVFSLDYDNDNLDIANESKSILNTLAEIKGDNNWMSKLYYGFDNDHYLFYNWM